MKLIDILVRELPNRGGWPDENITHLFTGVSGAVYFQGKFPRGNTFSSEKNQTLPGIFGKKREAEDEADVVTRAQYEAALLAKSAVATWNGEGLPPVGTVCERNFYDRSGDNWKKVTILFSGKQTMVMDYDGEELFLPTSLALAHSRPIRTEAERKREAAISEIDAECLLVRDASKTAQAIYDAIAAGKIPGVKLED